MSSKSKSKHDGKPYYEFAPPAMVAMTIVALPTLIYAFYIFCNEQQCVSLNPLSAQFLQIKSFDLSQYTFFTTQALIVYLSWLGLHVVLSYILPGPVHEGIPLDKQGHRLKYKCNGLLSMFVSVGIVLALVWTGHLSSTYAYDHFLELATSAIGVSFAMSILLFIWSYIEVPDASKAQAWNKQLAIHGHTGNLIYDFFVGRSLNPRLFGFDFKFICELRPGLIGWMLINFSFAAKQYEQLGDITSSMILVNLFQGYYVLDALMSEAAILTTMDITTDGFGLMLAFGDLAWVPFTYTLQARYLVFHPTQLSYVHAGIIVAICIVGMYIFRASNSEKNTFRTNPADPAVKHLKYMTTESGSKLLITGWWGTSRHPNYMGDLLMGLAWCLPCGFDHLIPYYYSVYFLVLLVHRQRRDDEKCANKYGKDWDKYCQIVKYRIFPYIY